MITPFLILKLQSGKKILPKKEAVKPKLRNPESGTKDIQFLTWYKNNTLEGKNNILHTNPNISCDYYSYFKNTPKNKLSTPDQHFPDTYKYPNHETFSNESLYSTPENPGGIWFGETYFSQDKLAKLGAASKSDNTNYPSNIQGLTAQLEADRPRLLKQAFKYDEFYNQVAEYVRRLLFNIPMKIKDKPFEGNPLTVEDIVEPAFEHYVQTGRKPNLPLLFAQAQRETFMGKKLKSKYNMFNIGNTTEGATRDFESFRDNVVEYLKLIDKDYLLEGKKPIETLLQNFVNYRGDRYAKDPQYEKYLRKQIPYIDNIINK